MRIRISISKGKTKNVKRLAAHNQELQEILGYSERIIPIADARKSSGPVALFEEIRQHACAVHHALQRHWTCPNQICRPHQAYLKLCAQTKIAHLKVLFVLEGEKGSSLQPIKQEVMIQPTRGKNAANKKKTPISYVEQASIFTATQRHFEDSYGTKATSNFSKVFSKGLKNEQMTSSSASENAFPTAKRGKQTRFEMPSLTVTFDEPKIVRNPTAGSEDTKDPPSQNVVDLCSSLRNHEDAVIFDQLDRQFQLSKSSDLRVAMKIPDTAKLVPLPELLDAHNQASNGIARHSRFGMAAHIASALLQIQMSPWLPKKWSKHELYFLVDSHSVYSDHPYVSQTFVHGMAVPSGPTPYSHSDPSLVSEEDIRACLFTVGVIILELIFSCNIESCRFRHLYYGSNNQPNDQTDVSTARKWAKEVLGECGVEIADVVRRCLDCSFGPKPSLTDKRFREAVYEGVIKPLADHLKMWPTTMP